MTLIDDLRAIERADVEYEEARNYWEGRRIKELFSSPYAAKKLGDNATKYMVNIAKRAGEAVLFKLRILGITITNDGEDDPVIGAEFKRLVVDHNKLLQVLSDWMKLTVEYGDAYLFAWDDVTTEESDAVDVIAYSPIGCRIFYDVETERHPQRWVRTWMVRGRDSQAGEDSWFRRVNIVDDRQVTKLIAKLAGKELPSSDDGFTAYVDEDPEVLEGDEPAAGGEGVVTHDYGRLPVFHGRTERPYGVPEHACLYGLQNLMIKDISSLAEGMDGFALPFRFRTLEESAALRPGSEVFEEDEEQDSPDKVRAEAGALANLYGTKDVGQLMPADADNLLAPIDKIMSLAASVSITPMEFFDVAADASGAARRQHADPFVSKCETRKEDLDSTAVECLEFVLRDIMETPDTYGVTLEWKPIQERTRLEVYADVTAAQAAGMPAIEAWVENGYDRQEVQAWDLSDIELESLAKRLRDVAAATKDLGSAATLGVGQVDGVAQMMADLLRAERPQPREVNA